MPIDSRALPGSFQKSGEAASSSNSANAASRVATSKITSHFCETFAHALQSRLQFLSTHGFLLETLSLACGA